LYQHGKNNYATWYFTEKPFLWPLIRTIASPF
jgi:hypothetical protein